MKTIKSLKTVLIFLGLFAMVSSCKKGSFETAEPSHLISASDDNNQPSEPGEHGNCAREFGCILKSPVEYSKLPKAPLFITNQTYPTTFSLSCPPIRSQGGEPSCVAWGATYAARSIIEKYNNGGSFSNSVNIFSPEYTFNVIKNGSGCSTGAFIDDALDLMTMKNLISYMLYKGACVWSKMPYSDTDGCSNMPNSKQKTNAASHLMTTWGTLSVNVADFKSAIYNGHPIIVGGPVDTYFWKNYTNGIYDTYKSSEYEGNHCYCVVGWDANKNAFKIMNSWGTDWGINGYAWVSYSIMSTMFQEAYVIF